MSLSNFSRKRASNPARNLISVLTFIVFLIFDFVDAILCVLYQYVDVFMEGRASPCCCQNREKQDKNGDENDECELSETLYGRKNVFKEMGFLGFGRKWENSQKSGGGETVNRWSDCGCESCLSWMNVGERKLHVFVREPSQGTWRISHFSLNFYSVLLNSKLCWFWTSFWEVISCHDIIEIVNFYRGMPFVDRMLTDSNFLLYKSAFCVICERSALFKFKFYLTNCNGMDNSVLVTPKY